MSKKENYVVIGVISFFIILCVSVFFMAEPLKNKDNKEKECISEVNNLNQIGNDKKCDTTEYIYNKNDFNIVADITEYKEDFYSINLKVNDNKVKASFFNDHIDNPIFYKVNFELYNDELLMIKSNSGSEYNGDYLVLIDKSGNIVLELLNRSISIDKKNNLINVKTIYKNMYDCINDKYKEEDTIYKIEQYTYQNNIFELTNNIDYTYKDLCKQEEFNQ